ncbi:M50 family metallopeptidase [Umezawaea sp. NPDC059074]|uniref:M50 family metallopeptidase n=1 Tax=Umezawaea sp. NPDC059074 TaxID=3346716 RepID=UPI0036B66335
MSTITELWDRPDAAVVLGSALVALVLVLSRGIWRVSRNVVTIAHEGGHALFALLSGRRLSGITLHSDTSGVTVSRGKPTGFGMVLTGFAGYVAASLLGLGGAALVAADQIRPMLWGSTALLIAMLVMIRNVFGVISVVVTGGIVFAVSWFATVDVQNAFGYLFCWFLLFGGVRPVWELQRKRVRGRAPSSDADQLARLTGVPGTLWVLVFGAVALACLYFGGMLLLAL